MDDEGGVKVPVTRLRRRLSVEQSEEVKSSPAANTPTKKRGGRRAAKPELDLIDENAPDNNNTSKRTTRKAVVKELEEVEEKPLTPSRRSARIRSNTSIVSETTQTFDSPRAKRVARRASQVGSDNEAVLTPVRQTRRTRKDSTSNVENAEPLTVKPMTGIIVEEEAESSRKIQKSPVKSIEQNHSPSGSRKSPRLSLKKNKNSNQTESNDSAVIHIETTGSEDHNSSNKENETETPALIKENHSISDVLNVEKNNLSESSSELLQKLKTEPDKITSTLNKSTSAITDKLEFKSKRHRTKSWTTLSAPPLNDNIMCLSDSESIKKKRKSKLDNSSDTLLENSPKTQKNNSSFKKIKKSLHNDSANKLQLDLLNTSNQIGKEEIPAHPESSSNAEAVTTLFEKEPSTVPKTTIFIEETDSNSEKNNKNADDDQCVPEVEHYFKEESKNDLQVNLNCSKDIQEKTMSDNKNNSCEPMDIDETIPDNVSLSKPETSVNKDSKNKDQVMECSISQGSKKRKSSLTTSNSEVLEKSCNENKSTLVLSQLKDISNDNHVLQSSHILTEKKSKYDSALDTTQDDNGLERKNSLSAYSTSTPLNQKGLMKLAMKINTSDMTSNNTSKIEKSNSEVNKKKSNISNTSSEESESEEESEQEKSKFIDDEAEEASCDYESGDSKDEEQEQYEKENEIVQKGETLTSEDELSNDSDYEKDSFIVSSDEEDDELLNGSGDDLSMSDNELKMTKESKQKYNERKLKEQKKASREMFESRHKLNMSKESNKSESLNKKKKRAVIDSSVSEDDDTLVKAKKNNKMRLDSSHETSASKSLDDTQVKAKKKNKMRLDSSHETSASMSLNNSHNVQSESKSLSKSIDSKSATNEVEMTICVENSNHEVDPLAIGIKKEPMTPKISSTNVSIQFVDPENSVENEGGKNKSHRNMTHIDDPLEDSNASNSSDSSDNIHIQNYDSVLNELNNSVKNKKNKTANISLNLDTKTKQKATPIIDELNLTQIKTKTQKKNRNKDEVDSSKAGNKSSNEKSYSKNKPNNEENDNESSDSIDIHLLFSEDSNSSENQQINKKVNNEVETFIPLKKNPGKTNILEISGNKYTTETNKKKNELNKPGSEDEKADDDDVEIHFIMDTTGTHNSTELEKSFNVNTSLKKIEKSIKDDVDGSCLNASSVVSNKSYKETRRESKANEEIDKTVSSMHNKSITKTPKSEKKKKRDKKMSESLAMNEQDNNSDSDIPAEVCNKSLQETVKEKMNIENNETVSSMHNKSITKTPKSEKKKKRNSESLAQDEKDDNSDSDAPAEVPNKSFRENEEEKIDAHEEINKMVSSMHNNSTLKTTKSEKKKKRISESSAIGVTDKPLNESVANTPASVNKKKKKLSESQSTEQMYEADESINKSLAKTPVSEKKKGLSESQSMTDAADEAINKSMAKTSVSEKKKKKRLSESQSINLPISTSESPAVQESQNIETDAADETVNKSMAKTPLSEKKKKKRLSESQSISLPISTSESPAVQESQNIETDEANEAINKSMAKTPFSERKKKKRLSESQSINLRISTSESPAVQESQNIETDVADEAINKSKAKTPLSEKKKKKRLSESQSIHLNISTGESPPVQESQNIETENLETMSSKKRKRKSSHNQTDGEQGDGAQTAPITLPEPKISEVQNKRRKISHNTENTDQDQNISKNIPAVQKEQRRKNTKAKDFPHNSVNFEKGATETDNNMDNNGTMKKETKKRKQREDDLEDKSAKVQKTNSLDKVNVPRLPTSILNELEENPKKKNLRVTKSKVISTSNFIVEEAKTVKNKPSNYLEESVYLNEDDLLESKKQKRIKNPRVLPFLPTVSTSNSGYTTNFKVNVIPKEFKFSAKSSNVSNFKNDFLENKKIKRIGTYELYKRNRNVKLSKF